MKLQEIPVTENGEPLIDLQTFVFCEYRRRDSPIKTIKVRKTVALKLESIQKRLTEYNPSLRLLVTEGYRSPFYQESYYIKEFWKLSKSNPNLSPSELMELTHQFVALPSVAGHPTGGAIDLTLVENGLEVDMGCAIADFNEPTLLPTHSETISILQKKNRLLLHDLMVEEEFAPFYGEWWHFSYGDREWADFYKKTHAIYGSL